MRINVVCTGTELLRGHTLNTNLLFLGGVLAGEGYAISRERCVPDTAAEIAAAVAAELQTAEVVITIGGLGPTSDDLTRDAVAGQLGVVLQFDAGVHADIVAYLGERAAKMPPAALRVQAMVPEGAVALPNANGTAPGLWCPAGDGKVVIMLPGPPREFQPMVMESVLPRLKTLAPPAVLSRGFTVCGVAESLVAEKVELFLQDFPGITPAYCARLAQVDVRLTGAPTAAALLDDARRRIIAALGNAVLPDDCPDLPACVGALLREKGLWLATAESCTGGWIAKTITDLPGASTFFCGGIVSYSNDWKSTLLDVADNTLTQHGAVSAETVTEMLNALFQRYEVDAGIAVTGIAGPTGASPDKPVGLVYIATGFRRLRQVERFTFPGNRESVRQRTVTTALNQLRLQLIQAQPRD